MSIFGPIVTTTDTEDAVKATLQAWLDTMLGEVERQSDDRWGRREIKRPVTWTYVTDYRTPAADRRLPCIAVESGPEARSYNGDGSIDAERGLNIIVIAKGQSREKTRHTLEALVQAVVMVLEMHGDLDGHADGTVIGEITPDAIEAEKAKTVAGARIPIAVLVPNVGQRRGGPEEPDAPAPTPLPDDAREWPDHTSTNVVVEIEEA